MYPPAVVEPLHDNGLAQHLQVNVGACRPTSNQWRVRKITCARLVDVLPDTSAAREKPRGLLDQSSLPVLGRNMRGHLASAHMALHQLNRWMTEDLLDAWKAQRSGKPWALVQEIPALAQLFSLE